ncbi:MAG: PD-(D/E)XK nuclease domain-containing protein [Porphyromonadaceae bacterium]|nr:MAG: PD-(D/E)XK nuclease domain-containing protein [Porphyromonadaceae bacterium]
MYVVFSLLNSKVDTEVKSIMGRADVVIKTKNDIYVLELKVDDSVYNALAQIDSKGYAIPYDADGRKVTKCGITISSEARNITHWRALDTKGNTITEQQFLTTTRFKGKFSFPHNLFRQNPRNSHNLLGKKRLLVSAITRIG